MFTSYNRRKLLPWIHISMSLRWKEGRTVTYKVRTAEVVPGRLSVSTGSTLWQEGHRQLKKRPVGEKCWDIDTQPGR